MVVRLRDDAPRVHSLYKRAIFYGVCLVLFLYPTFQESQRYHARLADSALYNEVSAARPTAGSSVLDKENDGFWPWKLEELARYPDFSSMIRGHKHNNITVNITNAKYHPNNAGLTVDVLSVGSQLRLDFLQGQMNSWASHTAVRHFWGFSEMDDSDPNCSATIGTTQNHFRLCKRVWPRPTDSALHKFFQMSYGLGTRKKPPGWLCAQTRFGQAIGKVGAEYRKRIYHQHASSLSADGDSTTTSSVASILPDYLLLVDDDTYVDVEAITHTMQSELAKVATSTASAGESTSSLTTTEKKKNEDDILLHYPRAYGGCVYVDSRVNLTIPIGGFAVVLTKASVLRFITPIFCSNNNKNRSTTQHASAYDEFQSATCRQLRKNELRERKHFREGMTLSDLSFEWSKSAPKFCFNSDWLYAYFVGYYGLSDPMPQWKMKGLKGGPDGFRLHPYLGSVQSPRGQTGQCLLSSPEACYAAADDPSKQAHFCHYQTPESMMAMWNRTNNPEAKRENT